MVSRRVIIWDLENTLYAYSPSFGLAARKALVQVIRDLQIGMTPAQAWDFAKPTYPLQTIRKLEALTLHSRHQLFLSFHDNLQPDFINPDPLLVHEMQRCPARHVLITHSSRKFSDRALARLGLSHVFPYDLRLTAEDLKGSGKNDSSLPIQLALRRLQARPQDAVMVDDRDDNLAHAKAMGITTILVGNHGRELDACFCDLFYPTAGSFLHHFNNGLILPSPDRCEQPYPCHAPDP